MTPRHQAAVALASAGVPVFPCRFDSKEPRSTEGFKDATIDTATIDLWWAEADYNLAFSPEDAGLCVVDLDGAEGIANWEALCREHGTDPYATRRVRTPGGGLHLYYEGSLRASQGTATRGLGNKIDTRGVGSYVLMPPSYVVEEKKGYQGSYTYEPDAPSPAELPEWVAEKLARVEVAPRAAAEDVELDQPASLRMAQSYLARAMERDGAWGQEDPADTYPLVARLKDLGVSQAKSIELLVEPIGEHEREWLTFTVNNAWRYGQNQPGSDAPPWANSRLPTPEEIAEATPPPVEYPLFKPVYDIRSTVFPVPEWVWQDRLLMGEPNLYTGDAGVGKTTLAENIAVAVAAGVPLLGADTKQMPVVLLVAEDTYGPVRDNLLAIRHAFGVDEERLRDIHLLSVKADRIPGGHRLASIDDNGAVELSPFMAQAIIPALAGHGRPILFVLDPLVEFIRFNRQSDEACRSLATSLLYNVTQVGAGVTALVTDHPSKASMATGDHYAGSTQLKAAFSLFATLKGGKWSGNQARQRELTFSVVKGRYAGEQDTRIIRTDRSPAFEIANGPSHVPDDQQIIVYKHVAGLIADGIRLSRTNAGEHGPGELSFRIGIEERELRGIMGKLCGRDWLKIEAGAYALGSQAPEPSSFEAEF